ncbi:MAG: GTPase ObgE [Candidatus Eisenbacteria bacterium]|nr:GTPase ObgE [Candidatus Eisenbacteria bacterium]
MFVDECIVEVEAGRGGDGCISFRREKFVPRGGPDGGDGGDGGSVHLVVDPHRRTLGHLRHVPRFRAGAGKPGQGKEKTGARGEDLHVGVPPGTLVVDAGTGELLADAVDRGQRLVLARGGRGGRGNAHFKRATRRAPRIAEPGGAGEARRLRLTLKLLADVGLVGLPNAGKSTLLSRLSNARPRIADYPFTTLAPVLGIVPVDRERWLVMADLPGLISGAHAGRGLGQRFLRHIERTRVLLILIDVLDPDPLGSLETLLRELSRWSGALGRRERIVCYSKADLLTEEARDALPRLTAEPPLLISAQSGEGLGALLRRLSEKVLASEQRVGDPHVGSAPGNASGRPTAPDRTPAPGAAGRRPWPHRWVIPRRAGARIPEGGQSEEQSGGRADG